MTMSHRAWCELKLLKRCLMRKNFIISITMHGQASVYFYKVLSCQLMCAFCWVSVRFRSSPRQYGPFHIPENAVVGTTVTAVLAGDADVRGGDSWQVDYRLESGNEEEVFTLVTDKQTNEVTLVLSRVNNTNHPTTHVWLLIRFRWENSCQIQIKLTC